MHVCSFRYSFLLRFITGYWLYLPVQYSRTLLFIHPVLDSLCLWIPNSWSFHLHLSSLSVTANPFFMSVSLFLFYRYVHLCHIWDFTYKQCHMVFVFLFLTLLSMIISGSIHVATTGTISFFSMANTPLYIPHLLYLLISWWAFRFFSCLGYCE